MLELSKITAENRKEVEKMLKSLRDNGIHTATATALNFLCWKDFPALQWAQATLTLKSKDQKYQCGFQNKNHWYDSNS